MFRIIVSLEYQRLSLLGGAAATRQRLRFLFFDLAFAVADLTISNLGQVNLRSRCRRASLGVQCCYCCRYRCLAESLLLWSEDAEILWSSNVSNSVPNSSTTLLDSGNLVLQVDTTEAIAWESFQHPCDTFLPRMKPTTNLRTNQKIRLTSWKSPSDPSTGRFSAGVSPQNIPQAFIWKDGHPYWRTGPWNGQFFTGAQSWVLDYHSGYTIVYDKEETVYATFAYVNVLGLSKHFLDSQGNSMHIHWNDEKEDWEVVGFALANECDVYGTYGAFGKCYALSSPICSCLKGFEPKIVEEWNRGNWMSGCVRRTPLQCERVNNRSEGVGKADGFLKLEMVKVPDFAEWTYRTKDDCRKQCLENCSCVAYAYDTGIGCMSWSGNLLDLQKFSTDGLDTVAKPRF
ncbi:hypothetical protein SO802_030005 [Lithocarpus litseifolius]|uniref:Apple domain-containing protein n=1 Tax=Lithocarpus litseifolius TaxID=425828 RepID=A0AAW2BVA7_9ROSI